MAVKVYTPGQFYAAGGVVEERNDKESRIKAFDKLIGIYEAKVNGRAL